MKALSVKQPFATLIIEGYKHKEYRSWNTKFRGDLLIHSSKSPDVLLEKLGFSDWKFPNGLILGKVELYDVEDYGNGMFAFLIKNKIKFKRPIAYDGKLNLFDIPDELIEDNLIKKAKSKSQANINSENTKELSIIKEFTLDIQEPEKKYNMFEVIAEYGKMRGHIEILERENSEKNEIIKKMLFIKNNQGLLTKTKSDVLNLIKDRGLTKSELIDSINQHTEIKSKSRAYSIIADLIKEGRIMANGNLLIITENYQEQLIEDVK